MTNGLAKPTFETLADETLERVKGIYAQRGTEYADTWKNPPLLAMKATAKRLGIDIPEEYYKVIAMAALVDVKYVRHMGGYKEDSVDDGIAYNAVWAAEMRRLTSKPKTYMEVIGSNGNGHRHIDLKDEFHRDFVLAGQSRLPETAPATPSV